MIDTEASKQDFRTHMDLFTEKVATAIDPIADSVSTSSARLWLSQNLDSVKARIRDTQHHLEDFRYIVYYKIASVVTTPDSPLGLDLGEIQQLLSRFERFGPASQGDLRLLYVSYELGTAVLKFVAYTLREVSHLESFNADEVRSDAELLIKTVIEKSLTIKKSLDEGGWMDKVKESVQGDLDVEDTASSE